MTVYYDLPKPEEKHECEACGRDSGHHLNCPNTPKSHVAVANIFEPEVPADEVGPDEVDTTEVTSCLAEGCQDAPKPYGGRGPRPKYCAAHGK